MLAFFMKNIKLWTSLNFTEFHSSGEMVTNNIRVHVRPANNSGDNNTQFHLFFLCMMRFWIIRLWFWGIINMLAFLFHVLILGFYSSHWADRIRLNFSLSLIFLSCRQLMCTVHVHGDKKNEKKYSIKSKFFICCGWIKMHICQCVPVLFVINKMMQSKNIAAILKILIIIKFTNCWMKNTKK